MRKHFRQLVLCAATLLATATPVVAQITDAQLADRVASRIRDYAHFSIFDDVNVTVADRQVTLTGLVTQPFKRSEIGDRTARIDGVRVVVNEIRVLPLSTYDADIRMRVAQAIYNHPAFRQYAAMTCPPIHIIVENGKVTLTGRVNSNADRTLAYALAQVPGTFSVTNALQLDR
jgi:hyperosmotically inducible protein